MNDRPTVEPIAFPTDARGLVLEPLRPNEFAAQRNAHLVVTLPGCIRGNHYHRLGTEVTAVLGPALVRVVEEGVVRDYEVAEGRAYRFTFPPGVAHAIQNTGATPQVAISFNTVAHDPSQPDVVREMLIEPGRS
jgi:dTDP-4-dehydrorhamnose 3,5-epimerase-like enzyme